jgi:hypothetical protein
VEKETKESKPGLYFMLFGLVAAVLMFLRMVKGGFNFRDFLSRSGVLVAGFLSLLAVSVVVRKYLEKSHKCSVCSSSGRDLLNPGDKKASRFCRNHLLETFRKKFLAADYNLVVVYPGLEGRVNSGFYSYGYYCPEDLKKYNFTQIIGPLFQKGLRAVSGKCSRCASTAQIAYFGKNSFQWIKDYPTLEKITQEPEIICKKCAVDLIIPSLRGFKGDFINPVELSIRGEGILFPWTQ